MTEPPRKPPYVAYLRVSTDRQGRSGLGLEAQREAVARYIAQAGGAVVSEYVEVESGRNPDRPQLAAALVMARVCRGTLIVAKLDRLARNARFLLETVHGTGKGGVVFCDLPQIPPGPVGTFIVTQLAAVAELEAGLTSQRTKAALQAAKARGVTLGNPKLKPGTAVTVRKAIDARVRGAHKRAREALPIINEVRDSGVTTLAGIAAALEARRVSTPSGRGHWHASAVMRILANPRAA